MDEKSVILIPGFSVWLYKILQLDPKMEVENRFRSHNALFLFQLRDISFPSWHGKVPTKVNMGTVETLMARGEGKTLG